MPKFRLLVYLLMALVGEIVISALPVPGKKTTEHTAKCIYADSKNEIKINGKRRRKREKVFIYLGLWRMWHAALCVVIRQIVCGLAVKYEIRAACVLRKRSTNNYGQNQGV